MTIRFDYPFRQSTSRVKPSRRIYLGNRLGLLGITSFKHFLIALLHLNC
ncbi:uncharacterized protein J3R85_010449 [Psidium guajava]|nr:uncharacterized protein J3R85_010449 [Psidium guajava]